MSSFFSSPGDPRPRQVTFGATLSVTGGLVLLFALLDLTTRLQSVEVTEALRDNLRALHLSGDVDVDQARDILRYSIMAFAVPSAATFVLGIFTLRRDRAARVGLTAVIGTIGVFAVFGGPGTWLVTGYVAVAVAFLWCRPARDWFDGRQPPPTSSPGAGTSGRLGQHPGSDDPRRRAAGPPPSSSGGPAPSPWIPPPPPGPASSAGGSDRPRPAPPSRGAGPPPHGPPPGWAPPPYGPPPGWRPPPGWVPPVSGPPPGWPHVPPPPPGWRPAGGWRPPPLPAPDDGLAGGDASSAEEPSADPSAPDHPSADGSATDERRGR
jgi:hypothetical protein